jgi:hypothetical protein
LISIKLLWPPIVEHQKIDAGEGAQQFGVSAVAPRERQCREQSWYAMIKNGQVLATSSVAKGAGQPTFTDTCRTDYQTIATFADSITRSKFEEHRTIQSARSMIVNILDAVIVAQMSGPDAGLEALLTAQRYLVLKEKAEPFSMFKCAGLRCLLERFEALGHAVQAKLVQKIEGGMG